MGRFQAENLDWLDQIDAIQAQYQLKPDSKRADLKKALDCRDTQLTMLLRIKACFDKAAIEKVRKAAAANPSFILSSNGALALTGLKGKVDDKDLPVTFHTALDVALVLRLAPLKITALVDWLVSGKPASEFDPNQKPKKTAISPPPLDRGTRHQTPSHRSVGSMTKETLLGEDETPKTKALAQMSALDLNKWGQLVDKSKVERVQGRETVAQEKLAAYILEIAKTLGSKASQKSSGSDEMIAETVFLDWIADLNVFKRIQAKRKKGKTLTAGEVIYLIFHKAGEWLGHGVKLILKTFKPLLRLMYGAFKMVIEALKELGLYKHVKATFTIVMFVAAIWFAWEAFHYGVMRPVEMVWSKLHLPHFASKESPTPVPTAEPTSQPISPANGLNQVPLAQSKPLARHAALQQMYQPAAPFIPSASPNQTLYDPKLLEQEIAAIPADSVIKDYVFQPDEGMPGDLAVSRLQDLTDADKYTMMIGGGKQKILSVNATTTNLIVNYKGADLFSVFGDGSGQLNFFWEDVKYIHTNAIYHGALVQSNPAAQLEASPQMPLFYQCSLVVSGSKNPLTIQCATPEDLEHLVSTMEYFIRNSRLAHDAQPGGMPYPSQGLVFNNDGVVEKLWPGSPMDKAGVTLGDHLWSIGKVTSERQSRSDLEKGLSAQVPVTIFVASSAEWNRALIARDPAQANSFKPKLRKVVLDVP